MENQKNKLWIKLELLIHRLQDNPSMMHGKKLDYEGGMDIKEINRHLMGVHTGLPDEPRGPRASKMLPRFASLDRVGKIVVIAGGGLKMRGLAKLLDFRRESQGGRRFMDLLIIDQATARTLLEFKKPL